MYVRLQGAAASREPIVHEAERLRGTFGEHLRFGLRRVRPVNVFVHPGRVRKIGLEPLQPLDSRFSLYHEAVRVCDAVKQLGLRALEVHEFLREVCGGIAWVRHCREGGEGEQGCEKQRE